MRPNAVAYAAVCLTGFVLAVPARATPDPAYVRGKTEWLAQRYRPATEILHDYRTRRSARSAQVDYMIGTGGCRVDGRRAWGLGYLKWALYRYSLSPASRALVLHEHELCRGTGALPRLDGRAATVALQTAAGSWAQGKMYYLRNAEEPVATYTARPLGTLDPEILARRLVPVGQASAIRAALQPTLAPGARTHVVSRYAFVTTAGHTDAQLAAIATRLNAYLGFLDRTYGIRLPDNYLTLYLVRNQGELTTAARDLHQLDVSPATIGYTFRDDQSAVAIIPGQVIGTLYHELFHLAVRSTFGDIPQWLDEGMAALYEVSDVTGTSVRGIPNWRGPVLRSLWSQRPTLEQVITADWYVSDTPGDGFERFGPPPNSQAITAQFAVARYFALYLQDKGKLAPVFARVQAMEPSENLSPAAATLAAVTAEIGPIDAVQVDFDRWFAATECRPAGAPAPGTIREEKYEPGNMPARSPQPCATQDQQVRSSPISKS